MIILSTTDCNIKGFRIMLPHFFFFMFTSVMDPRKKAIISR